MKVGEVLADLELLGDERAIAIWNRLGIRTPDRYYGVNLTKLKEYAKKLRKNHELALELWKAGVHDAKLLATYLDEPKKVTREQIAAQIEEVPFFDLGDKLCSNVIGKTPYAAEFMREWTGSGQEFVKRAGFMLLTGYCKNGGADRELLAEYLGQIERELQASANWVMEAMNYALIAIGSVDADLNERAVAAADRIGKVTVDYGETSCRNPDARAVLTSDKVKQKLAGASVRAGGCRSC